MLVCLRRNLPSSTSVPIVTIRPLARLSYISHSQLNEAMFGVVLRNVGSETRTKRIMGANQRPRRPRRRIVEASRASLFCCKIVNVKREAHVRNEYKVKLGMPTPQCHSERREESRSYRISLTWYQAQEYTRGARFFASLRMTGVRGFANPHSALIPRTSQT